MTSVNVYISAYLLTICRHTIESGRWNRLNLASSSALNHSRLSPLAAVSIWYHSSNTTFQFLDTCQGPYCNNMCPDRFVLGELTSNNWPLWAKITISSAVVGTALLCLLGKILFAIWIYQLDKKQDDYLESLDQQLQVAETSALQVY